MLTCCAGARPYAAPANRPASDRPPSERTPLPALRLALPTDNDVLFDNDGPGFYQYTNRIFQGRRSRPWEGGQYGFVRNPKKTQAGLVYTRFHEGIDIKPLRRDAQGEPLDIVHAVDDGRVVYVNTRARRSSYGLYVVVEHWWSGAPFYSLYAHLGDVRVRKGQVVEQGTPLGKMGYTGRGISRRRAHLHLEIALMLNQHFQQWYDANVRSTNHHGLFNGLNLAGLDVAGLYLALRNRTALSVDAFIAQQEVFFKVAVPGDQLPDLVQHYPWLLHNHPDGTRPPAWTIGFTQAGLPVRVEPFDAPVRAPVATMVRETAAARYEDLTRGYIAGTGDRFELTRRGKRHLQLLTMGASPELPPAKSKDVLVW